MFNDVLTIVHDEEGSGRPSVVTHKLKSEDQSKNTRQLTIDKTALDLGRFS